MRDGEYVKMSGNVYKWTDEDVRGVRNAFDNGFSYAEIAKEFKMKYAIVWEMVNRVTFKRVY